MYGYIYLTKNKINNRMYVGKHQSQEYDQKYFGSGIILNKAISLYGKNNFTNQIIAVADSLQELNDLQKKYIQQYRQKYGALMYNIANGGDGGDTYSHQTNERKSQFIEMMTEINKKRCSSCEFKQQVSKRMSELYKSEQQKKKQSDRIRQAWSNQQLRQEQRKRTLQYYSKNKKDNSYLYIPCQIVYKNSSKQFESVKELKKYLKEQFHFSPSNPRIKKMLCDGDNNIPYDSFHKKKFGFLDGMIIRHITTCSVETMGDECNPVGFEIGTNPKRKTANNAEDIVHSVQK